MNYQLNDYELIYMVKEESDEARELLVKKYDPMIKKIALHYSSKHNNGKIDVDDLFQEGRLALVLALNTFNTDKDILFYTYLTVCIKRRMINILKSIFNNKNYLSNYNLSIEDSTLQISSDYVLHDVLVENELVDTIINFKNNLNYEDSWIFELKYNNFTYDEISVLLDLPKKNIDNRLFKIRNKLKKYLISLNLNEMFV